MTKIRSYRIDEVHDDMEETLLDLDPCSDDAAKLRREIEQLKHTDPDMQRYLEQREIYAMAARLHVQPQESDAVIVASLKDLQTRRNQLLQALNKCHPDTERHAQLRAQVRETEQAIEVKKRSLAIESAQRVHNGGHG